MSAEQSQIFPRLVPTPATQLHIAGMEETVESQLEAMVAEFLALKDSVKRYHELRKEIKDLVGSESFVKLGKYTIHPNTLSVPEKSVRAHSQTRLNIR